MATLTNLNRCDELLYYLVKYFRPTVVASIPLGEPLIASALAYFIFPPQIINEYFILGGIKIDFEKGLLGHSDADVVIHAICDSILGALNMGDIGSNFPDNDSKYKDIDSKILLEKVKKLMFVKGYNINNIDVTICLQDPKINQYILKMKDCLSKILEVESNGSTAGYIPSSAIWRDKTEVASR